MPEIIRRLPAAVRTRNAAAGLRTFDAMELKELNPGAARSNAKASPQFSSSDYGLP